MISLTEGSIQITFPDDARARRFDDKTTHGVEYMKAVDFIIELNNRFIFIEIKDPDHPGVQNADRANFVQKLRDEIIDEELKYKYRDSFLYEWAMGRANTNKLIYYYVLIALESLNEPELLVRTDALRKKLPLNGPRPGGWLKPFVSGCMVFNIRTWNNKLPQFPVARIGAR